MNLSRQGFIAGLIAVSTLTTLSMFGCKHKTELSGPALQLVGTWNCKGKDYDQLMTLSADGTYTHIAYGGISASGKGTWSFDGKILVKTATGETEQESAGSELLNMSADQFQILVAPKMMLTWQRSR